VRGMGGGECLSWAHLLHRLRRLGKNFGVAEPGTIGNPILLLYISLWLERISNHERHHSVLDIGFCL